MGVMDNYPFDWESSALRGGWTYGGQAFTPQDTLDLATLSPAGLPRLSPHFP